MTWKPLITKFAQINAVQAVSLEPLLDSNMAEKNIVLISKKFSAYFSTLPHLSTFKNLYLDSMIKV